MEKNKVPEVPSEEKTKDKKDEQTGYIRVLAINAFLETAERNGWGLKALAFIYNQISPEKRKTADELEQAMLAGDITMTEFLYLYYAVKGNVAL